MTQLLNHLRGYKFSHGLATAVGMGVLEALANKGPMTTSQLAEETGIQPAYAQNFLRILCHVELAAMTQGLYRITPRGSQAHCDEVFVSFASYHMHVFKAWAQLQECCLKNAAGGNFHYQRINNADFSKAYLLAMDAIAKRNLPFLEKKCSPLLRGHLLDIGAGPSTFGRNHALTHSVAVTGIDFQPLIRMAQKLFTFPSQYTWVAENFLDWIPETRFDSIFCSHVLEYCSLEELSLWITKIKKLLHPGGVSAFVIFLRDENNSCSSIDIDLFEISTGLNSDNIGHIPTENEIIEVCCKNGGYNIQNIALHGNASYTEHLIVCHWE